MVNHPNRSATFRAGKELAETIMNAIAGRAGVRLNGEIVQWNSIKSKSKLCVGDSSISVAQLHANLTEHELKELENLPPWNGNNEYEISSTVLCHVSAAIRRLEGVYSNPQLPYDSGRIRAQEMELAMCLCNKCSHARAEQE